MTCGGGIYTRNRTCDDPSPANGGMDCPGADSVTDTCADWSCPGKNYAVTDICAAWSCPGKNRITP